MLLGFLVGHPEKSALVQEESWSIHSVSLLYPSQSGLLPFQYGCCRTEHWWLNLSVLHLLMEYLGPILFNHFQPRFSYLLADSCSWICILFRSQVHKINFLAIEETFGSSQMFGLVRIGLNIMDPDFILLWIFGLFIMAFILLSFLLNFHFLL